MSWDFLMPSNRLQLDSAENLVVKQEVQNGWQQEAANEYINYFLWIGRINLQLMHNTIKISSDFIDIAPPTFYTFFPKWPKLPQVAKVTRFTILYNILVLYSIYISTV